MLLSLTHGVKHCIRLSAQYFREAFGLRKLFEMEMPTLEEHGRSQQSQMLQKLIYCAACDAEYELAVVYVKKVGEC